MTISTRSAIASTVFRVAVGSTLVAHGTQKLFGWFNGPGLTATTAAMDHLGFHPARPNAVLAGIGEAGAGAALALGLATPAAGAGAAITMGVAAGVHAPNGFFATENGYEYPAILAVAASALALGGAGSFSLDAVTGRVFDRPWMRVVALVAVPVVISATFVRRRRTLQIRAQSTADEPTA